MKRTKQILYIGNNLSDTSGYITTMDTLSNRLSEEGFSVRKASNRMNKIIRLMDMCYSVFKFRNTVDYVLIDTFSTSSFYYAFLTSQLARFYNLKYIPILHGGNLPARLDKSPFLTKLVFENSFRNIAPSDYLKNEFTKRGYVAELIPNILELDAIEFKERNQLTPKLLWVRSFRHLYNPMMAIEVLMLIKKQYPEAQLCMVGPKMDNSFDLVSNLVVRYQLQDNVQFTGLLSKKEWYKKSIEYDFFINTTNFDNTPISVMEAMGLGLTVVSTNVGGMPNLLELGVEGVLVEKDDPNSMASEILTILETNNLSYMVNARQKVETFSWSLVKEKWFSILK